MLSQRIVTITLLLVSGFASMQAMGNLDNTSKALLKSALEDSAHFRAFEEQYGKVNFDADKVLFNKTSVAEIITARFKKNEFRKQALAVAKLVQGDRSNWDLVFQTLFAICETDATALEELRSWTEDFEHDADATDDLAHPGKTIGGRITDLLKDKATRKHALAIALIVQDDRSDEDLVFQTLCAICENDITAVEELERWVAAYELDADKIADPVHVGRTIGDRLTERLSNRATREDAFAVAWHVQEDRSNKDVVFQTLYRAYESDPTALTELENWTDEFEENVDVVQYDPAKPGKTIGERIASRLSKDKTRKDALAVAKLVQQERTDKEAVLRTLYTAYENDQKVFPALKEWQEFVQADVKAIRFDPAQPETIAHRIEALKRDDLSDLFKLTAGAPKSKPADDKKAKWSRGKKIGVFGSLIAAGAGLAYYYYTINKVNNSDRQTLAA